MHDSSKTVQASLLQLYTEHRDLDEAIHQLSENKDFDQLRLRRLKKRKLLIKDRIEQLNSLLIPDIDA